MANATASDGFGTLYTQYWQNSYNQVAERPIVIQLPADQNIRVLIAWLV